MSLGRTKKVFKNLDWGNWLRGLFTGMIGGGSSAVVSAITVGAIDTTHTFTLGSSGSIKLMVTMFVVSAVKDAFLFLKQNPLPVDKLAQASALRTEAATLRTEQSALRTEAATAEAADVKK